MTERDRKAERDASRRLRRADTAASMLRMLYVMGALPAAMLVYFHGGAVLLGSTRMRVIFTAAVSAVLLIVHVLGIAFVRRFPFVVSLALTAVQSGAWIFYLFFAPSAFSLFVPPILALMYACGIVPMVSVRALKRDHPELWSARHLR